MFHGESNLNAVVFLSLFWKVWRDMRHLPENAPHSGYRAPIRRADGGSDRSAELANSLSAPSVQPVCNRPRKSAIG